MKLNNLQIIGRIGQNAEIKTHQDRQFLVFSVAVDESYKDNRGQKVERKTWYDCSTNQERFFKIIDWLSKGREVFVEGRPSVRTYTDREGKFQAGMRIDVQNISLGHSPHDQPAAAAVARPAAAPVAAQPVASFLTSDEESNDLPF